ncbi:MAG: exodeoxyribonuclease V subunit beta [Burkholderiales bacterium]
MRILTASDQPEVKPQARRLDVVNAPLDSLNLIEANAGTGKTWTITALYVRLLLEAERSVESILVVTFTESATAELRERIRNRLADARAVFERGSGEGDEVMAALLDRVKDREQALLRLTSALRDFDQAPIYTIHGFCQRVLGDTAFESGMPFRTEILVDQSALLKEIVDDFWRKEIHAVTPLFARFLIGKSVNPDSLANEVVRYIGKPYLDVRRPDAPADVATLERMYESAFREARASWLSERESVHKQLIDNPTLSGSKYRAEWVRAWLQQMEECLSSAHAGLDLCKQFDKFTPDGLKAGTKTGKMPPKHPFYDACATLKRAHEALIAAYTRALPLLKARLLEYCNTELAVRKERRQLQSYDDLLLNLDSALKGAHGATLAAGVRERYSAALIDEFQDTDPVQYSVFHQIYGGSEQPVFLVGDPKQSIYSFRGADVFAYLDARANARRAHTLDVNWRSEPTLLAAINRIFGNAATPFVIEDIPFHASEPASGDRGRFVIDGESAAPFEIWFADSSDGKAISKNAMKESASRATAAEIARLLNLGARGQARIVDEREDRPLRGGDIAVLVRNHDQARAVRDALSALGVASVQRGAENVFLSAEAEELERLLLAIAEPGREQLIGAALATEMMGYSGETLQALKADESRWEEVVESFREAHREWRERGFIPMLRSLLHRYDVVCRLLNFADGERRVTNLLHLTELMHCGSGTQGISGLLASLAAKRKAPEVANLEEILRLESDENLVKILTIHVAKGLEYPLVFCPFMWDGNLRSAKSEAIKFHDPAKREVAVLDFGSETLEDGRAQAVLEEHAENMRLLYVALTRAKYRCWMVWGRINEAETSAPAWLLHRGGSTVRPAATQSKGHSQDMPQLANMRADLERLAASSDGAIRVVDFPASADIRFEPVDTATPVLTARAFTGAIRDTKRVTSFTGLTHGRAIEAPDYDAADREPELEAMPTGRDIFSFPRGAHAGKCLHAIFEHVDFTNLARPELERVVGRDLAAHGFESIWVQAIADMVQRVVETPLDDGGALRLDRVPLSKRLDELEFYYPLSGLTHGGLKQILLEWGFPGDIRERIGELTFATMHGYMRGFIDIVFEHGGRYYLADYKSNWLGPTINAYQQEALTKAMGREAYYLQYLVYCVALHRYLQLRVRGYSYDTHFGGVRYLFVRGMHPDSGSTRGIYADTPPRELIGALDRYLKTGMA